MMIWNDAQLFRVYQVKAFTETQAMETILLYLPEVAYIRTN